MPSVKQSPLPIAGLVAFFALAACANTDLARFAPPGIVKYEDLAGDQPINPAVAARVEERKAETGTGRFPKLAETPGKKDRPRPNPADQVSGEMDALDGARDAADAAMSEARAEILEEESEILSLRERRAETEMIMDADAEAAARERREKLPPPDYEDGDQ